MQAERKTTVGPSYAVLAIVLALLTGGVHGQEVEILALNSPADLDLSGDVV